MIPAAAILALAAGLRATGAADAQQAARVERRLADKPSFTLDLGTWGRPGAITAETVLQGAPRFESTVTVEGRGPRDPNQAMAEWWDSWDLPEPTVYGQNLTYRPGVPINSVNLLPLIDLIVKKIKHR
jgi:hypothetical protein